MNNGKRAIQIPAAILMLLSLYLPLSPLGSFRTMLYVGNGILRCCLLSAAACSFLVILFSVRQTKDGPLNTNILLVLSMASMLAAVLFGKLVTLKNSGVVLFLLAAAAGLIVPLLLRVAEETEPCETDCEAEETGPIKTDSGQEAEKPMRELLIHFGELAGCSVPLAHLEPVVIGRDPKACNIIADAPNISRRHCKVIYNAHSDTLYLEDFSKNGTYVIENGTCRRIGRETIYGYKSGASFYLGSPENSFAFL